MLRKLLMMGFVCWSGVVVQAAERPNIVVILTDDMGFSDLGCFGGEIETPNLDALASGGLRLTEFYNMARCWPTRATLMSGRYTDKLQTSMPTIPEVLKSAGYQTGMVGKWHLGKNPKTDGPVQRGFDDFYGTMTGAGSFYDPYTLTRNTEATEPDGDDFYYTDKIGSEAVRQIRAFAGAKKPFFQYVAFTAAHWPIHAPEKTVQKYLSRYQGGWDQLRDERYQRMLDKGILTKKRWPMPSRERRMQTWESSDHKAWHARNMAVYAAMVDHMDQAVGQIVAALKQTKAFENTVIFYMHDNGACAEHLKGNGWNTANNILEKAKAAGKKIAVGDVYETEMGGPDTYGSVGHNWAHAQNTPLRRYKANVHEGGACTPAIMHWGAAMPAAIKGTITQERGHVVDLMATCVDLADGERPESFGGAATAGWESRSLKPILVGDKMNPNYPYYFNHSNTHAVIRGDYKLVREWNSKWHLYNLTKNKTETVDLAPHYPELTLELRALWNKRWKK